MTAAERECEAGESALKSATRRRSETVVLALMFGLAACGGEGAGESPPAAPTGGFTLGVEPQAPTEDQVTVSGSTNLPDGTAVTVAASRGFLNPSDDETNPRQAELGRADATVDRGRYTATLAVDNSRLLVGLDLPGGAIDVISPTITVCAYVPTGDDFDGEPYQPDPDVREVLGDNGEALVESQTATEFGSLTDNPSTWLEVLIDLEQAPPLEEIERLQGRLPVVEHLQPFCAT